MNYKRGDIVIIDFPFSDLSKSKKRPALIISNNLVNRTDDYLMVQITSKAKNDPLSFPHTKTDYTNRKGLPLKSFIRIHKIFLLNESLIKYKASSVTQSSLELITYRIIDLIK